MVDTAFMVTALAMALLVFVAFARAVAGPTAADRIVAINVMGTKAILIMVLVSFALDHRFFLDVSMVYALISFLTTVGLAKYLESGHL